LPRFIILITIKVLSMPQFASSSVSATPAQIMKALIELNDAQDASALLKRVSPKARERVESARSQIPLQILAHHDRMRSRGRRSVAAVRHSVCSVCHLSVSGGLWNRLKRMADLALCENCGSYIYYAEDAPMAEENLAPAKPIKAVKPIKPILQRASSKAVRKPAKPKPTTVRLKKRS
jgi:ElaB/YqjD/DUF883 family membrane-anchored ribosome-binding protein